MFLYLFLLTILISNKSLAFTTMKSKVSNIKLNMLPIGGSNVALVTPMKSNNKIDYESLTRLLIWHEKEQTDGIVLLGTTGEGSTINMSERSRIIETAVNLLKNKIPIIVGTGAVDPNKVIELTKNAKDLGADASLVITPYYVKPPQRALITHFSTIADSIDLPMILYNCPGRTGVDMKPETISKLSIHPNIIGVKDATGDLNRVNQTLEKLGKDFLQLTGNDDNAFEFNKRGGNGAISVTANIAPKLCSDFQKFSLTKDSKEIKEAQKLDQILQPLHHAMFVESNPSPVKYAAKLLNLCEDDVRLPLVKITESTKNIVKKALKSAKLI